MMTTRKAIGWALFLTPLTVMLGVVIYRGGWMTLSIVALAVLLTSMIYKGLDLISGG